MAKIHDASMQSTRGPKALARSCEQIRKCCPESDANHVMLANAKSQLRHNAGMYGSDLTHQYPHDLRQKSDLPAMRHF